MEVIGKFVKTLPEQRGTSQKGDWVRGGFVNSKHEAIPKQLAFSLWGEDKVAIVRTMTIGTQIKVFLFFSLLNQESLRTSILQI